MVSFQLFPSSIVIGLGSIATIAISSFQPILYTLLRLAYHSTLYNNQINARALIGQSAVGYCAGKPTEKLHVF